MSVQMLKYHTAGCGVGLLLDMGAGGMCVESWLSLLPSLTTVLQ